MTVKPTNAARIEAYEAVREAALTGAEMPDLPDRDREVLQQVAVLTGRIADRAESEAS